MNASREISMKSSNGTFWLLQSYAENKTQNDDQSSVENIMKIKKIADILLLVSLLMIMLSMGFKIRKDELLYHIKKPIGVSIGMFSQFIILPLCAFILLQCIPVTAVQATGVLLMSCCPGGAMSNIFAYFSDGDLPLSIAMTSLSTVMAMGMMPLNLWMYGRSLEKTEGLVIPYVKLVVSLVCITAPVGLGMLLRWKIPRIASVAAKVGSLIAMLIVVTYFVIEAIIFPNMFSSIPANLYAIMMTLPFIGFSMGFGIALILRQNTAVRKTIAIECGVQNVPTALAVITLSFPAELQREVIPLAYLYGFGMLSTGLITCIIYQISKKCSNGQQTKDKQCSGTEKLDYVQENSKCKDAELVEPMLKANARGIPSAFDHPATLTALL